MTEELLRQASQLASYATEEEREVLFEALERFTESVRAREPRDFSTWSTEELLELASAHAEWFAKQ